MERLREIADEIYFPSPDKLPITTHSSEMDTYGVLVMVFTREQLSRAATLLRVLQPAAMATWGLISKIEASRLESTQSPSMVRPRSPGALSAVPLPLARQILRVDHCCAAPQRWCCSRSRWPTLCAARTPTFGATSISAASSSRSIVFSFTPRALTPVRLVPRIGPTWNGWEAWRWRSCTTRPVWSGSSSPSSPRSRS